MIMEDVDGVSSAAALRELRILIDGGTSGSNFYRYELLLVATRHVRPKYADYDILEEMNEMIARAECENRERICDGSFRTRALAMVESLEAALPRLH